MTNICKPSESDGYGSVLKRKKPGSPDRSPAPKGAEDGIASASTELWGHNSLDRGFAPMTPEERMMKL